jgi:hypothetical protein
MSHAQSTPLLLPHTPIPTPIVYDKQPIPQQKQMMDIVKSIYQYLVALPSMGLTISSVI